MKHTRTTWPEAVAAVLIILAILLFLTPGGWILLLALGGK